MTKVFLAIDAVLAVGLVVYVAATFLAGTVADNWVPILAVFGAVGTSAISPVVMANLNNRAAERRAAQAADIAERAKKEDYRRQDEVAARVLEAAGLAATVAEKVSEVADTTAASNAEVAKKVSEVADTTASAAAATEVKLDEVAAHVAARATSTEIKLDELAIGQQELHTLANSHYTASMQSQLVALRNTSVALTTLADLQEASGKPTFQETRRELADNNKAVKLLEREINDRLLATEQAAEKSAGQNA